MGLPARKLDRVYTYADCKRWPDDERWELIEGTAWNMSPAPSTRHQAIVAALTRVIGSWAVGRSCAVFPAPFDVVLPDRPDQPEDEATTVVQPDISVICDRSRIRAWGCYGSPDWIVEILSPFTTKKDLNEKSALYGKHRVAEYWVVDPGNRFVHVYRLAGDGRYGDPLVLVGDSAAQSHVCQDLTIRLDEVFAEP